MIYYTIKRHPATIPHDADSGTVDLRNVDDLDVQAVRARLDSVLQSVHKLAPSQVQTCELHRDADLRCWIAIVVPVQKARAKR